MKNARKPESAKQIANTEFPRTTKPYCARRMFPSMNERVVRRDEYFLG
jgi:hypothetical protein